MNARRNALKKESTKDIIQAINLLLQILNERGKEGEIVNWDDKKKKLGMIKSIGSSHYYMEEKRHR